MAVTVVIILILFVIIIIFSFPQFSPVPYFPSNGKDISLILNTLAIRDCQTIIDLGAGDGIVILKAAERAFQNKLDTQFIAVEINPILLLILHIRRLLHSNRKNIRIVNADMFTIHYSQITNDERRTTFYIYISPWFIEKTISNITRQIKRFDLVSYFYQVKYLSNYKEEAKEGVHKIYRYSQTRWHE